MKKSTFGAGAGTFERWRIGINVPLIHDTLDSCDHVHNGPIHMKRFTGFIGTADVTTGEELRDGYTW